MRKESAEKKRRRKMQKMKGIRSKLKMAVAEHFDSSFHSISSKKKKKDATKQKTWQKQ